RFARGRIRREVHDERALGLESDWRPDDHADLIVSMQSPHAASRAALRLTVGDGRSFRENSMENTFAASLATPATGSETSATGKSAASHRNTLLLTRSDVSALLDLPACIDWVE